MIDFHTYMSDLFAQDIFGGAGHGPMNSSLVQNIVSGAVDSTPWGVINLSKQGSLSVGFPESRKLAQLPVEIAPGVARLGTEYVSMVKQGFISPSGVKYNTSDPYGGLGNIVAEQMNVWGSRYLELGDSGRSFKIGRAISEWKAINTESLFSGAGLVNIGAAARGRGRVNLMLGDRGRLANEIMLFQKGFASSLLGQEGNPLELYEQFKKRYISEVDKLLNLNSRPILPPPGSTASEFEASRRLTTLGIKDVSFNTVRRQVGRNMVPDTMVPLQMMDPESLVPFASLRDYLGGVHHQNQFVATFAGKGFSPAQLHPLVAHEGYKDSLKVMRGIMGRSSKGLDSFGSVYRADVSYLVGSGATAFWSAIGGDAGQIATSHRMVHAAARSTASYKRVIPGVRGRPNLPNADFLLHPELMSVPGFKEALADPNTSVFKMPSNFRIKAGRSLAKSARTDANIWMHEAGDFIDEIRFGDTGLQLTMRRANPAMHAGVGITMDGARATLGMGALGRKQDILAQGAKWSDPQIALQRYLSHYADRAIWAARGEGKVKEQNILNNLRKLSEMTGLGLQTTDTGLTYLHTGGGKYRNKNILDMLGTDAFHRALAQELDVSDWRKIAPEKLAFTEKEAIQHLTALGNMTAAEAKAWYVMHGKELTKVKFLGQNIRIRQNVHDVLPSKLGVTNMAKVRAREARQLAMKFRAAGGFGLDMARTIEGNIGRVTAESRMLSLGAYAPLLGDAGVNKLISSGPFNRRSLSGMSGRSSLIAEIRAQMVETGGVSPELFGRLTKMLGFTDAASRNEMGVMVSLKGTALDNIYLHSGAREGSDYAVRQARHVMIPNPYLVSPQLLEESTTGLAGNIRIPRNPVAAGTNPAERQSLQALANWMNTVEQLMDSKVSSKLKFAKSASLMNISMYESMIGSDAHYQKGIVKGFTGGRFRQQVLPGSGIEVGLTEEGILTHFKGSSKRGLKASREAIQRAVQSGSTDGLSIGEKMVVSLRNKEDVYGLFKRFPGQSIQQSYTAKLRLVGNGGPNIDKSGTIWTSNLLAALTQGDFDTDDVNFYMLSQSSADYKMQQAQLAKMHKELEASALPEYARLMSKMRSSDANAGKILAGDSPTRVAQALMGMQSDDIKRLFQRNVGSAEEAQGAFFRQVTGSLIGTAHTFASSQMRMVRALSGVSNEYRLGQEEITALAKAAGLKEVPLSLEASYVPYIYGFLKKKKAGGPDFTQTTLEAMSILREAGGVTPDSMDFKKMKTELARRLKIIGASTEPGFMPMGNPIYQKYIGLAKDGEMPTQYYRDVADQHLRIASLMNKVSKHGLSTDALMGSTRAPMNVLARLAEEELGMPGVSGMSAGGAELVESLSHFASNESVVTQTAMAAEQQAKNRTASEIGKRASRANSLAKDIIEDFGSSKNWGHLKMGGMAVGGFAAAMAYMDDPEPEVPPPTLPPNPILGQPVDGAYPGAVAPRQNFARIDRVEGQRRHFPVEDVFTMPSMQDIMPNSSDLDRSFLGVPSTRSQAIQRKKFSSDF